MGGQLSLNYGQYDANAIWQTFLKYLHDARGQSRHVHVDCAIIAVIILLFFFNLIIGSSLASELLPSTLVYPSLPLDAR